MQNEIMSEEYSNERPDLAQPHFDEEATLLSARPVVPLAVVEQATPTRVNFAKSKNRRDLLLAGASAAAVILGVFAGILFYSSSKPVASKVVVEEPAPATQANEETVAEISEADEVEAPLNSTAGGARVDKAKAVVTDRRVTRKTAESDDGGRPKAQLFGVIRSRRALSRRENNHEAREERRPRRVRRRQSSGAQSPNELFRIGEIFEGAPRP